MQTHSAAYSRAVEIWYVILLSALGLVCQELYWEQTFGSLPVASILDI